MDCEREGREGKERKREIGVTKCIIKNIILSFNY